MNFKSIIYNLYKRIIFWPSNLSFNRGEIMNGDDANKRIMDNILNDKPCFIARCGGLELDCCEEYYYIKRHINNSFSSHIKEHINVNAGVFPNDDAYLDIFSKMYAESIRDVTTFAVWGNHKFEKFFIKKNSRCTHFVDWLSLFPSLNDWPQVLVGMKVLVVSPFVDTIERQYKIRKKIYEDEKYLPNFELITYKPVVSHGWKTNSSTFNNWEEALLHMFSDIQKLDFDICLLSCGAYGLPLGSLIHNKMKKKVVHIGGSLQLLFGIKGAVYESDERVKKMINDYWVYPSKEETPEIASKVENACYWAPKNNDVD